MLLNPNCEHIESPFWQEKPPPTQKAQYLFLATHRSVHVLVWPSSGFICRCHLKGKKANKETNARARPNQCRNLEYRECVRALSMHVSVILLMMRKRQFLAAFLCRFLFFLRGRFMGITRAAQTWKLGEDWALKNRRWSPVSNCHQPDGRDVRRLGVVERGGEGKGETTDAWEGVIKRRKKREGGVRGKPNMRR